MSKILPHCMGMPFPEQVKKIGHLKVNGKLLQLRHSPAEERLKRYLSSMADDELVHISVLARRGGFSQNTIYGVQSELFDLGLCHKHERCVYYGNTRAIKALKALLAQSKP